jgi:hypothetical protein
MKKGLVESHDAMMKFLQKLIRDSDKYYGGKSGRTPHAQRNYRKAEKLVENARSVSPASQSGAT